MTIEASMLGHERVACETCMKEVPISEAIVPEATDYVAHFCGAECYDRWRKQSNNPSSESDILTRPMTP
jgi:hypothetical protein